MKNFKCILVVTCLWNNFDAEHGRRKQEGEKMCCVCLGYGQCSEILQNLHRERLQPDSWDIRTWLSSIFDGKILTSMFLMIVVFFFLRLNVMVPLTPIIIKHIVHNPRSSWISRESLHRKIALN